MSSFSKKDPEIPKLSNNTKSKLELSSITNIKKIGSVIIYNVTINTLRINALSSKLDYLPNSEMFDISIITETKVDYMYLISQFHQDGYSMQYKLDRNGNGGGVIIYVREYIPSNFLRKYLFQNDIEGRFVEINFSKSN